MNMDDYIEVEPGHFVSKISLRRHKPKTCGGCIYLRGRIITKCWVAPTVVYRDSCNPACKQGEM